MDVGNLRPLTTQAPGKTLQANSVYHQDTKKVLSVLHCLNTGTEYYSVPRLRSQIGEFQVLL